MFLRENLSNQSKIIKAYSDVSKEIGLINRFEQSFLERAYRNGNLSAYFERLNGIDFKELDLVLDFGCGYGQWSMTLASLNNNVIGTDIDPNRISFCKKMAEKLEIYNVNFYSSLISLEEINLTQKIDAIFSYQAVPCTAYKHTLKYFYKLLKPGGRLYFSSYDLGWLIYSIDKDHGGGKYYDSKKWAIKCIKNTVEYLANNIPKKGTIKDGIYMPQKLLVEDLSEIGFSNIIINGDGTTTNSEGKGNFPFFISEYYSHPACYEVLCTKEGS